MQGVSPRNSDFLAQMTPRQPQVLQASGHELATWEKCVEIGRVVSYIIGSVLFLIGSIYFYPQYTDLWIGNAGEFASWAFVLGCIMYFLGANLDFIQTIRHNHGTQLRQVLRAFNVLFIYMASCIFILGALYFLPTWYPMAPELGCWSFFIGCILYCITAIAEIIFVCTTHEDPRVTGFRIKNIVCWTSVMAVAAFLGALFFILGSWYYLPRYINRVDNGTYYMNKAITFYVIGSVFFVISAFAMIPDVLRAVKVTTRKHHIDSKV
ncbi:unnamed protein product [Peronospora belbahrii]|uniref:YrhK domain-containing protein n=1 Tax=Peronospora belbahrii TaxID=622444 RepID=A0AAU9KP35_9STRA|nr:unnamed protein product [Peronospora belbahrii]CAH0514258.1 unnamed protein product [Peronospora belbahrii]